MTSHQDRRNIISGILQQILKYDTKLYSYDKLDNLVGALSGNNIFRNGQFGITEFSVSLSTNGNNKFSCLSEFLKKKDKP